MYERLKYLYSVNKLSIEQLDIAVSKDWITQEQKELIINQ